MSQVSCAVAAPLPAGGAERASSANRPFRYFLVLTAFQGVLGRMVGYFLPIYFADLGFTGVQIGLYFTVASVSTLVLSLPMGVSTDRHSIARIFMASSFLVAISYVGFIFTKSYLVFCGFALLGSFGGRFYMTARSSLFFKIADNASSHSAGLYQLVNFGSAGIGMLIGSLIIAGMSFHHVFIAACAGNLAMVGLSYFLPDTEKVSIKFAEYSKDIFTPKVLFITAVFTLSSTHWGAEMVSYSRFLKEDLGLTIRQTGLYTSGGFVFVGLGAYLGVLLLKYRVFRSLQDVLLAGFILAGLFHILMVVNNPWLSFGMRLLHEIGDGLVMLAFYHGIGKIFHINKIGGCAAFISLCMGLGGMGSSIAFGWVGDTWGHQWPLIISGGILLGLPVLLGMGGQRMNGRTVWNL